MSDQAQNKPTKRVRKPANISGAQPPKTDQVKAAAATAGLARPARVSVPVVPEFPSAPEALSRRASALRLGLLTTTLALIVGGFAWFSDAPDGAASDSLQTASTFPLAAPGPADPLDRHVRESMDQEFRLAALALDLQQSHESLARLGDDARSLAATVGALSSGIEGLKSDAGASRNEAAARLARLEQHLDQIRVASSGEPVALGDPALQELTRLGHPEFRAAEPLVSYASAGPQPATATSGLSEASLTAVTTGALPEASPAPEASVKVSFNKQKSRARSPKPINGWLVHAVRDDLALVESQGAHYEVRAGELLPGAGIVRSIKKRGEQWVVLTNRGVITEAK